MRFHTIQKSFSTYKKTKKPCRLDKGFIFSLQAILLLLLPASHLPYRLA